jgi:hypothetical protein
MRVKQFFTVLALGVLLLSGCASTPEPQGTPKTAQVQLEKQKKTETFNVNIPLRKYLVDYFTLEVDLFHGKLDYIFKRFRSIFPIYFQLNLFKLFLLLLLVLLIKPVLGFVAMFILFGALYVSQKNPRATTSFLFYSFFSQASYMFGALKGWKKNKVLFL